MRARSFRVSSMALPRSLLGTFICSMPSSDAAHPFWGARRGLCSSREDISFSRNMKLLRSSALLRPSGSTVNAFSRPNCRGKTYFSTCTVCAAESSDEKRLRTSIIKVSSGLDATFKQRWTYVSFLTQMVFSRWTRLVRRVYAGAER